MALNAASAGWRAAGVVGVVDGHRADDAAAPSRRPCGRPWGRTTPTPSPAACDGSSSSTPPWPLMYCFSTATSSLPRCVGHGGAVEVRADEVVPDDLEVAAPQAVHVAGAGGDVDAARRAPTADASSTRLPPWFAARSSPSSSRWATITGSARSSQALRLERVERVEPAALDADVEARRRRRSRCRRSRGCSARSAAPAGARAPCRCRRRRRGTGRPGVGELERVAAPRAGEDDVLVVRPVGVGILEHRRAALDDVVELVLPDDLAGAGVDLAQVVVVAAGEEVRLAAVDDDARLPGPAAARPLLGGSSVVLAGAPAAAEVDLPEHVEALRRRAQPVEPAPVVAEEGADLDAVAVERRGGGGGTGPACAARRPRPPPQPQPATSGAPDERARE